MADFDVDAYLDASLEKKVSVCVIFSLFITEF
jgi:hypothetical protein